MADYVSLEVGENKDCFEGISDPLVLGKILWPEVYFYEKEQEMIYSVWNNDRTVVPAGHKLGKDFTSAFITIVAFLTRHPCKIVTTSVDGTHLRDVFWGELKKFLNSSSKPLSTEFGGPLVVNHMHIRKMWNGKVEDNTYIIGRTAKEGEGMSGHHLDRSDGIWRTLAVADECSGVRQENIERMSEWAHRMLLNGNPYDCDNEFKWSVEGRIGTEDKGGDIPSVNGSGYKRKIIRISCEDSPNVQYARLQQEAGLIPDGKIIMPGVLTWDDLCDLESRWDKVKICIGLRAHFYKGGENLLFPPTWLDLCEEYANTIRGLKNRKAKAMGIDVAEGGDKTAWSVVDDHGLMKLVSKKTPDTSVIYSETIALGQEFGIEPENWVFDRGGGGKEHADYLRRDGYNVRTVSFGKELMPENAERRSNREERQEATEIRHSFYDMRARLFGTLSQRMDPAKETPFAIPLEYAEVIRKQLGPIPKIYITNGVLKLPPKRKKKGSKEVSLEEIIGHSPDEADSLVLAEYGRMTRVTDELSKIGAAW